MGGYLEVESPGLSTTVQDLGRYHYAHLGISAAGAADAMALRIGNLLAGNHENEAALEMTISGGVFRFTEETTVVIAGSHSPVWKPTRIAKGETLDIRGPWTGARCYLCVRGGLESPIMLGSRSTHQMSGLGAALRKGGRIAIGDRAIRDPRWEGFEWPLAPRSVLRVTAGPQAEWFGPGFYGAVFEVKEDSNRMGLRLRGPAIDTPQSRQLLTEGASSGAVQIPPGGEPIILFVDHQTTGGYPKIANVISADLWRVGQLRPRDRVRFQLVSLDDALELLRRQERIVEAVR